MAGLNRNRWPLWIGNSGRFASECAKFGPDIARFVKQNAPGRSLWYTRLATERLIFDNIERLVDPNAARKFERMQRRAEKEFGQSYFAPPGQGVKRLPDLGAVTGR